MQILSAPIPNSLWGTLKMEQFTQASYIICHLPVSSQEVQFQC